MEAEYHRPAQFVGLQVERAQLSGPHTTFNPNSRTICEKRSFTILQQPRHVSVVDDTPRVQGTKRLSNIPQPIALQHATIPTKTHSKINSSNLQNAKGSKQRRELPAPIPIPNTLKSLPSVPQESRTAAKTTGRTGAGHSRIDCESIGPTTALRSHPISESERKYATFMTAQILKEKTELQSQLMQGKGTRSQSARGILKQTKSMGGIRLLFGRR